MFYFGCYGTKTTQELLNVVLQTNFKGHKQFFNRNPNGDFNHLQNFFIWIKNNNKEYIRITLLRNNLRNEELRFFWNLEPNFKPFAFKHNHRVGSNLKSLEFKADDDKTYLDEFLKMVNICKELIKTNGIK